MRLTISNSGFYLRICMASCLMSCLFLTRVFPTSGSPESQAGTLVLKTKTFTGNNRLHQEYVVLHTDRDVYVAGESLYFKASLVAQVEEENPQSGIFYLVMRNQAGTVAASTYRFAGTHADGIIYLHDTLSSGYYELLAYTNWMRSMGDDSYFCKTIFIANRFDKDIKSYLSVQALNDVVTGIHTMTMTPDSTTRHGFADIEKTIHVGHETDGSGNTTGIIIEHPQQAGRREKLRFSLKLIGVDADKTAVSVSISQRETMAGVRTACLPASLPRPTGAGLNAGMQTHFIETDAWILSGQIIDKRTSIPMADETIVLSTPDSRVNMMYVKSGIDGVFHIAIPSAYNNRDIYLSAFNPGPGVEPLISLWDKFTLSRPFSPVMFLNEASLEHLAKSQDLVRAKIAFGTDEVQTKEIFPEVSGTPVPLYAKPIQLIFPQEYTFFENLWEISREIVPFWRIRQSGNTFRSSLVCAETRLILPAAPVYFLDGIIMYDINPLIYLNSAMIDRIEIHNLQWVFGEVELPGIVAIFTNTAEYLRMLPDLPYARAHHAIFQNATMVQTGISHENKEKNPAAPDLRQVLYWNPEVVLHAGESTDISFYTGDLSGDFVIRVEGVSPEGSVVQSTAIISIR